MVKIHWYHRNLKCWGFTVGSRYFDISFPPMEGWGWSWARLVRVYWKSSKGREYLYLPGCDRTTR